MEKCIVEKKTMSGQDKQLLERMRHAGKSYAEISIRIGVKEASIRTYCSRHGLTDDALITAALNTSEGICPNCGTEVLQAPKRKSKRFCCDRCRMEWWAKNRICSKRSAYYTLQCKHCGKEFISYGNNKRKYCSHRCYIEERFGPSALSDNKGSI